MKSDGYWFRSSRFEIEPGEDEHINPGIYGKQLSIWLKSRLQQYEYSVEDIIEEDWGRCLMCSREPFLLWVGVTSESDASMTTPDHKGEIVWHCFATAEVFFWKRLFRRIDPTEAVAKLNADLGAILSEEPLIQFVQES